MRRSQRRGKEISGGGSLPACSRTTVMGMKTNSQWMEGFIISILSWAQARTVQLAGNNEEEAGGPAAHQDARERFDAGDETPAFREHEIAVSHSGVSDDREVERRFKIRQAFLPPEK